MLKMIEQYRIKEMHDNQNFNISEISDKTGHDRKTIRKYINQNDWEDIKEIEQNNRKHKIDQYKEKIETWLEDDRKARRKQRHTAIRVYNRLKEEYGSEFKCSYRTVAGYVKTCKSRIFKSQSEGSLPLQHIPGEAQIDFGKADFYEQGILYSGSYLVVSFPFSNAGFIQVFKGENGECLQEGLKNIFSFIKGVPMRIWLDNMSTVVVSIEKDGKRVVTDNFLRFSLHYGFKAVFCNVNAGNEKGNVENKVGYTRRNKLVPVPEFKDIKEYNQTLLQDCMEDHDREHYKKGQKISTLFENDKARLLYLPEKEYACCRYERVRTDGYGKFTLNEGKHTYSSSPAYARSYVNIKLTAYEVIVMDQAYQEIVCHHRLYGHEKQERMNWLPYLTQLSRKPRALKYTGIYDLFPAPVKAIFDNDDFKHNSCVLKALAKISNESSFETGIHVLSIASEYKKYDMESLMAIYQRICCDTIEFPHIRLSENIPELKPYTIDMKVYDNTFLNQVADNAQ